MNDGTRDIGNTQAPVLLFRGLDPLSGPQAIHQAMRSSAGPGKEGAKGMKRIILIKDKVTMASFGFAFVEFVDVQVMSPYYYLCFFCHSQIAIQSASTVLANSMSPQIHPNGFRISDRPVAASFAHPDSFQPIQEIMLRDEACLTSSLALGGVEGTWVRYWDESSTVAVLEFQVAQPTQPTVSSAAKEKKDKKKKGILLALTLKLAFTPRQRSPLGILLPLHHPRCLFQTNLSPSILSRPINSLLLVRMLLYICEF